MKIECSRGTHVFFHMCTPWNPEGKSPKKKEDVSFWHILKNLITTKILLEKFT